MVTRSGQVEAPVERELEQIANGSAVASFLGAGIGAFAMGLLACLSEAGIFVAPALYAPAGGVSGRTSFAVLAWLLAWGLLHHRWNGRQITSRPVYAVTLILMGLGILGTFPPVWRLF